MIRTALIHPKHTYTCLTCMFSSTSDVRNRWMKKTQAFRTSVILSFRYSSCLKLKSMVFYSRSERGGGVYYLKGRKDKYSKIWKFSFTLNEDLRFFRSRRSMGFVNGWLSTVEAKAMAEQASLLQYLYSKKMLGALDSKYQLLFLATDKREKRPILSDNYGWVTTLKGW